MCLDFFTFFLCIFRSSCFILIFVSFVSIRLCEYDTIMSNNKKLKNFSHTLMIFFVINTERSFTHMQYCNGLERMIEHISYIKRTYTKKNWMHAFNISLNCEHLFDMNVVIWPFTNHFPHIPRLLWPLFAGSLQISGWKKSLFDQRTDVFRNRTETARINYAFRR